MHAAANVKESQPPADADTPFSFSMEGSQLQPPPALIPRYQTRGWNSIQALAFFQNQPGGSLRGGESGRRLIEPAEAGSGPGFRELPAEVAETPSSPADGQYLAVPLHHLFGSEEQSSLAPAVAGLAPQAYIALGPDSAGRLGLDGTEELEVTCSDRTLRLPCRIVPSMADGVAGIPVGLQNMPFLDLPQLITIRLAEGEHE